MGFMAGCGLGGLEMQDGVAYAASISLCILSTHACECGTWISMFNFQAVCESGRCVA